MKNIDIINNINNLNDFINDNKEIPAKLGYAISRNLKILINEYNVYDEERKKIINGNIEDKNEEEKMIINNKLQEILDIDIDVNIHKIDFAVVENCNNFTAKDWFVLGFMIKDSE